MYSNQPIPPYPNYGVPSMPPPAPLAVMDPASAFMEASQRCGTLTCSQLQKAIEYTGVRISMEVCNQFFLKYDMDRSGTIDQNEFNLIISELGEWIRCFNSFDVDGSRCLDYNEFVSAIRRLGYSFTDDLIRRIFFSLDSDRDGLITLNGFIRCCTVLQVMNQKMNCYNPQGNGIININFNQLLDIVFSLSL